MATRFGFGSLIGVITSIVASMAMAVLCTAGTAVASDYPMFLSSWPSAEVSLQVDSIAHEAMLVVNEPSMAPGLAFAARAKSHKLFTGDGFGFGRIEPRL